MVVAVEELVGVAVALVAVVVAVMIVMAVEELVGAAVAATVVTVAGGCHCCLL